MITLHESDTLPRGWRILRFFTRSGREGYHAFRSADEKRVEVKIVSDPSFRKTESMIKKMLESDPGDQDFPRSNPGRRECFVCLKRPAIPGFLLCAPCARRQAGEIVSRPRKSKRKVSWFPGSSYAIPNQGRGENPKRKGEEFCALCGTGPFRAGLLPRSAMHPKKKICDHCWSQEQRYVQWAKAAKRRGKSR